MSARQHGISINAPLLLRCYYDYVMFSNNEAHECITGSSPTRGHIGTQTHRDPNPTLHARIVMLKILTGGPFRIPDRPEPIRSRMHLGGTPIGRCASRPVG